MTKTLSRACLAGISLLIGSMSACTADPGLSAPAPMRIQAVPNAFAQVNAMPGGPSQSQAVRQTPGVMQAAGSDAENPPRASETAQSFAKGFKAGYADALKSQRGAKEREAYFKLRAKYGDRFAIPGAKDVGMSQAASQSAVQLRP